MRAVVSAEDRRLAKLNLSTNPLMKPSTSPLVSKPPLLPPASATQNPTLDPQTNCHPQSNSVYGVDDSPIRQRYTRHQQHSSSGIFTPSRASSAAPPSDAEPTSTASSLTLGPDRQVASPSSPAARSPDGQTTSATSSISHPLVATNPAASPPTSVNTSILSGLMMVPVTIDTPTSASSTATAPKGTNTSQPNPSGRKRVSSTV
ncbi:unnamed protein product [Tilletia laevis]|uniref:Uncharacterized protein n=1 Tax=Tilletia laevis TaxID=157183 RepID=A0A9N8LKK0_9BASI|nr:unnamed protein product [Tilletia laevis]